VGEAAQAAAQTSNLQQMARAVSKREIASRRTCAVAADRSANEAAARGR